ncbi:acyl-CoA dehydrogenase family protein [Falsigemmobacter faecalis]|uniref:Acyl-CoA dehydrogenase n=1 Tax=Falsigemmobacter faecalis TaxID=2488730 RepID=A0A3P3DX25_9RHOB|nr:acyl-CoA dehydrogenase family protein [Falsigemmobacter faecalis]RRH77298.1 acyl-CoA dehydrogenase [Falsigemmobacter faecalis]
MSYKLLCHPEGMVNEDRVKAARDFAEGELSRLGEAWDRGTASPEAALRRIIPLVAPILVPQALGGHGESVATLLRCYEELARRDIGFTCALAVHTAVTIATSLSPNAALRDRILPGLMSGESIGAFLLTEPQTGTDATAITCAATPVAGGYRLSGEKAWVTNGKWADVFATFCQTEAGSGAKGINAVILRRDMAGLSTSDPLDLTGNMAMGTTDARFQDIALSDEDVAFATGTAFRAAMYGIDVARLGVAAMCNGALAGALDVAISYAAGRQTFGRAVIEHQAMGFTLADVATGLEASRALTFQAARPFESGQPVAALTAHAKKYACRTAFEGISQAMRALGANALKRGSSLPRQLNGVRVTECMDGTGEVQNIVISRALRAGL